MTDVLSSAEDCARDGAAGDQEALALAQRAGAGDRSAQSDLLARVVSSVHARVRSLMRNRADVEDVPQAARKKLRFVFVEDVDGAVDVALD